MNRILMFVLGWTIYSMLLIVAFLSVVHVARSSPDRLKVAIIDTGLEVRDNRFEGFICGYKDLTGEGIQDIVGHGTHISGIIKQYTHNNNYCLYIIKYYKDKSAKNGIRMILAIEEAIRQHANIVNISSGGADFVMKEYMLIKNHPEILFVTAAGNNGLNIDLPGNNYFPASYSLPNIISVGSLDEYGDKTESSNYGERIVWERGNKIFSYLPGHRTGLMSGTSQATARRTARILDTL